MLNTLKRREQVTFSLSIAANHEQLGLYKNEPNLKIQIILQ